MVHLFPGDVLRAVAWAVVLLGQASYLYGLQSSPTPPQEPLGDEEKLISKYALSIRYDLRLHGLMGKMVDFGCPYYHVNQAESVRWFHAENEIPKSAGKRRKTVTDDWHLRIHHTRKDDRGIYRCEVNLTNSIQYRKVKLVIHEKPTIVNSSSEHMRILLGQDVGFHCRGVGKPEPRILWLKNGKKINDAIKRYKVIADHETRKSWLIIEDAELQDAGNYTCRLRNLHGHEDFTASLTVQEPPPISHVPPIIFNSTPRRVKTREGHNVTLSCTASNDYDNTSIQWECNATNYLSENVSFARETSRTDHVELVTSRLTLKNVRPVGRTLFICTARNHIGSSTAIIALSVQPSRGA